MPLPEIPPGGIPNTCNVHYSYSTCSGFDETFLEQNCVLQRKSPDLTVYQCCHLPDEHAIHVTTEGRYVTSDGMSLFGEDTKHFPKGTTVLMKPDASSCPRVTRYPCGFSSPYTSDHGLVIPDDDKGFSTPYTSDHGPVIPDDDKGFSTPHTSDHGPVIPDDDKGFLLWL